MTLEATAQVMKDGVTCQVSNEHGADSKTVAVSLKRGQCARRGPTVSNIHSMEINASHKLVLMLGRII